MTKLLSLLLVAVLIIPTCVSTCVTRWFDRDDPSGVGDFETLLELRKEYPEAICLHPTGIEAQTLDGTPASATGQVFSPFNTKEGFACVNKQQRRGFCLDYRVRFICPLEFCSVSTCVTRWFDRDDPSGVGDFETLVELRKEYPEAICLHPTGIEAQTLDGTPASATGQVFSPFNTKEGFACVNKQQRRGFCLDYRVRFICPLEFCSGCTTPWFDRDNPSGYGDYELLSDLRKENPNAICDEPYAINVQTVDKVPALETGQTFATLDPSQGFACVNEQQKSKECLDYMVQFTCPKTFC